MKLKSLLSSPSLLLAALWFVPAAFAAETSLDTGRIEKLTRLTGTLNQKEGVLKALRGANINIVAIHNHMIGESPRYVFLHYWGVGPVADLARGLQTALRTQTNH